MLEPTWIECGDTSIDRVIDQIALTVDEMAKNVAHCALLKKFFDLVPFEEAIVGYGRASNAPNTSLVLDALEQAIHDRRPGDGLIQHTDRGVQYLSIRYSERLADIGITPSVGRVGSSYDCQSLGTGFRKNRGVLAGTV